MKYLVLVTAVLLVGMGSEAYGSPGPMPSALQWWEKKDITPVAVELAKKANLKKFYNLLGKHIPAMKACNGMGLVFCLPRIGVMRGGIDLFLRKITRHRSGSLWWRDGSLCWVATIMVYGSNLRDLHAFIRKQLRKPSATKIDTYFKKIVNAHGGPLIGRNWNTY